MATVEVGRGFWNPKTYVIRGQVIAEPHHDRLPVVCIEGRTGEDTVEAPNLIQRQVTVEAVICLLLMDVIEVRWEKLVPALMISARCFACTRASARPRGKCL